MKIYANDETFIEDVKVAKGILSKMRGLMFRNINNDEGMLFIFKRPSRKSMWMPFVPQDLSIFYLNSEKEVIDKKIAKKLSLNPKTWKIYKPKEKCKYVLECHKEKLEDIKIGDKLEWDLI